MSAAVTLRESSIGDLDRLLELERASFGDDAFSRRQLRYLLTRARGACFTALLGGEIAGYVSVLVSRRHLNARIYSLVVDPGSRRNGVAAVLVGRALEFARAQGMRSMFLEVRADNAGAIRLYEKNGFVRRAVKPAYYRDYTDAYSMARTVD